MGAEKGRETTYQWLLRALGAFLDEEPTCRITITEVPDGFLVRMQRALHKLEPKVLHFNRFTLVEQLETLMQQRRPAMRRAHHQGIWAHFPNGHQDFLRALGFELDQASAFAVLIDELEEGIILSYGYADPATGSWRKRLIVLGMAEIEEILNAAFERRKKPSTVVRPT